MPFWSVARRLAPAALLLAWSAPTLAAPRVRLETGSGYDTNITRAEGAQARLGGGVLRLVADLEDARRLGGSVVGQLAYQGGVKHFFEQPDEDVVFQRASVGVQVGLARWLIPGLRLTVHDRTSRAPQRPRDYTRVSAGPRLDSRLGPVRLGLFATGERLAYKPNPDFSADAVGGGLRIGLDLGSVALGTHGLAQRRGFDGGDRQDDVLALGLRANYTGPILASLEYDLTVNDSNRTGGGFRRHNVQLSTTFPLGLGLLASLKGSLQHFVYDDLLLLTDYEYLDDENRSSVTGRVEWPVLDRWSVVLSGGAWFSPFGVGTDFDRYLGVLGLAFNEG